MTETPTGEPFEFDPEVDQDWPTGESMSDYATNDDEVDLDDPEEETE